MSTRESDFLPSLRNILIAVFFVMFQLTLFPPPYVCCLAADATKSLQQLQDEVEVQRNALSKAVGVLSQVCYCQHNS